jgi:PPM family protein phosphatase
MTLALRYAVRSDVGLLREGNEDSAYAGPRLLAVADGMGGHAAGEVASAVAISALSGLDEDKSDADLLNALAEAVKRANQALHDMVAADPSIGGMGTTLTAMLWSGTRVALCHIGDSRAYVLSGGQFRQLTHDHTLVQSLVDDGRISPDEAATHPQRSLLLRALDGTSDAEPDLSMRDAVLGDRYLLCSDGLSSVVSEETLHRTLASIPEPEDVVLQLVELAIKGGGPDNITCIIADVVDSAAGTHPPTRGAVFAGAASNGSVRPLLRTNSPAGRAHVLTQTAPQSAIVLDHDDPDGHPDGAEAGEPGRRRWPIVTSLLAILLILIVGGGYAAWRYTQNQYYVGTSNGNVVIFRGINGTVAGVKLYHVYQQTGIPLAGVPTSDHQSIQATISATSLANARGIVANIRSAYQNCVSKYAALRTYNANVSRYEDRLKAWEKAHHTTKAQPVKVNGKTVKPPTRPKNIQGPRPVVPADCPRPPATAGGGSATTGGGS